MNQDREIQNTILSGERNREVLEMIRNWCAHARIEKFGGTGLIEMQTGLPIGHHFMVCDHAPNNGGATWHLADTAIAFHDLNCVNCTQRKPVGLPNISLLIGERDRAQEEKQKKLRAEQESAERAAAYRQAARDALRTSIPKVSLTILDQLDELDKNTATEKNEPLIETARLAPEIFYPVIIEHFFLLLENDEDWFIPTGLEILLLLGGDPSRLTLCAANVLRKFKHQEISCRVITKHLKHLDPSLIIELFGPLVNLARPSPEIIFNRPEPVTEPLSATYHFYPEEIRQAIAAYLKSDEPIKISISANAILALYEKDKSIATFFSREVIAILARAEYLIHFTDESDSEERHLYHDLQKVVSYALTNQPETTDSLINAYMIGLNAEAERRLLRSYVMLFSDRDESEGISDKNLQLIVFRKLIDTALKTNEGEILAIISEIFRRDVPVYLLLFIKQEIAQILGSAVLLDAKIDKTIADQKMANNFLDNLDYENCFQSLRQIQKGLIDWVAQVAANDPTALDAYLTTMQNMPDNLIRVRAMMIEAMSSIMGSVEGINAVLPCLYSAMMGNEPWLRSCAAKTLGEITPLRQKDLPRLIHESYLALLSDPYLIVHKQAARTLQDFSLYEKFAPIAEACLINIIFLYSNNKDDDWFLFDCISLYISRYASHETFDTAFGQLLVSELGRIKPEIVLREVHWFSKQLAHIPEYCSLIISFLEERTSEYQEEELIETLRDIDSQVIRAEGQRLAKIGEKRPVDYQLASAMIEILSKASAWDDAVRFLQNTLDSQPVTTRNTGLRLYFEQLKTAVMYEQSIAENKPFADFSHLDQQWANLTAEIESARG